MPEEQGSNAIGGPEPMEETDARGLLPELGVVMVTLCGGFLVFTTLMVPTRTMGATASARLVWEQRQLEVEACVAAQPPNPAVAANREPQAGAEP